MSKTKQKRLTAYFLLLAMCGAPVFAEGTTPDSAVTPNSQGAYIYVDDASAGNNYNIQLIDNWRNTIQGAVVNNSGQDLILNGTATGSSQSYTNNSSESTGGAVTNTGAGSSVIFTGNNATFSGNTSAQYGGAIYNTGSVHLGDNAKFENNTSNALSGGGGAIYSTDKGVVNIGNNAEFKDNRIDAGYSAGGAIAGWGSSTVDIGNNAQFTNNGIDPTITDSSSFGGAIYVDTDWSQQAKLTVGSGSKFTNNTAGYGGAIYSGSTDAKFLGKATFSGNRAVYGAGGAIYAFGGHAPSWAGEYHGDLVSNSINLNTAEFSKNYADWNGGAIFNYAQSEITLGNSSTQSKFTENESNTHGGAIYNSGYNGLIDAYAPDVEKDTARITLTNVLFDKNKASGDGGAIYNAVDDTIGDLTVAEINEMGSVTVNKGVFNNNKAGGSGGAIFNAAGMTINGGSSFKNNTATGEGGAIYNAGNLVLDTAAGAIAFSGNKAHGAANDIFMTSDAKLTISGGKKVTLGSGLVVDAPAIATFALSGSESSVDIQDNTELVLGGGTSDIAGDVTMGSGSKLTNNANTKISGDISGNGQIVNNYNSNNGLTLAGTTTGIALTNNGKTTISGSYSDADITNNKTLTISGSAKNTNIANEDSLTVSGTATNANIVNNKNLTVSGTVTSSTLENNSSVKVSGTYDGKITQIDKDTSLTVTGTGKLVADAADEIIGGTLTFNSGSQLSGNLAVTEAVVLNIEGSNVIDSTGLSVGGGHIVNNSGKGITLDGNYTVAGGTLGTSVTISNGSINNDAVPADDITIGDGKTLTLSNNVTSNKGYVVNGTNTTLKLAPTKGGALTLAAANVVSGTTGNVLVDEIVVTTYDYDEDTESYVEKVDKKGLGTVNVASDNSGFKGNYLQKMGNVVVQTAGKFFGGNNVLENGSITVSDGGKFIAGSLEQKAGTVNINSGAEFATTAISQIKGGVMNLRKGAVVNSSTISATSDTTAGTYGTVNIYNNLDSNPNATQLTDEEGNSLFTDEEGNALFAASILSDDIGNGNEGTLKYLNADGTTQTITLIGGAGLGLFNGTMIDGDLTLYSDTGVRDLTLGDGAGIYADNITLGDDTKLTYLDNAFIRDDSNVLLKSRANLTFANNTTDVLYTSLISSTDDSSIINKRGAGETAITSSLANYHGSVNVTGGTLDLQNEENAVLNNITVNNALMHSASEKLSATGNVSVNSSTGFETDGDLIVTGNTSIADSLALVSGDLKSANITLSNSNVLVNNDLVADAVLKVTGGTIEVNNDLIADKTTLTNTSVNVDGDFSSTVSSNINNTKLSVLGSAEFGDAVVSGNNSVINLSNNALFNSLTFTDDAVINAPADIAINGNLTIGTAGGSDNPTFNFTSGAINTVTAESVTLNTNANVLIDADPRSKAIDSIKANSVTAASGAQLLITGINFTQTPIDRNVNIDITKLLDSPDTTPDMVAMANSGVVARTEMGKYLLTASSSASSNMLKASLLELNPQMYRGQVATVASYANQLVVNNMLLDHTNIIANDLLARDKFANKYAATNPIFAPFQYTKENGNLWYKAYGNFERISMTQHLNVGNNAYGSIIGADFPVIKLKKGWSLLPTGYIAYNGGHQTFSGVSMYQNGAQIGAMGTAYKGNFITSLLAYGGGYHNHMSVHGPVGYGSDDTGNWFAGVASKTAYNIHLPADFILQPTGLISYNIFGNQNYHSDFGNMSMNAGFLNGINVAPGLNLIWKKKTFSLYGTAQLVFNIMGDVSGKAGNVNLDDVRMRTAYFEYGLGAMKRFKDTFNAYLQFTIRNGYRTGIGFQGGLQWKVGKKADKKQK